MIGNKIFKKNYSLVNIKLAGLMPFAIAIIKAKLLKKGTPLFVNWGITNRCNARCQYCKIWNNETDELTTMQIYSLIDELKKRGTLVINFTGGEPLVRDDVGNILDYVDKKGIFSLVNTNGLLVPQKISDLEKATVIKLSLDGPPQINDSIRGKGAFGATMLAIDIAKKRKIKLILCTVLSKYNMGHIDYILDKAKNFNFPVIFQPATQRLLGSDEFNPLVPPVEKYRRAIQRLIDLKKKSQVGKYIYNSIVGLKHMYNWPTPKKIRCGGGLIFCHIEPNGDLSRCARSKSIKVINGIETDFQESFNSLNSYSCDFCWCPGLLELNFLLSFNLSCVINLVTSKI